MTWFSIKWSEKSLYAVKQNNQPTHERRNLFLTFMLRTISERTKKDIARRGKDSLHINQLILSEVKTRRENVAMAWIDYKKVQDMMQQTLIIEDLRMYKISNKIINFIRMPWNPRGNQRTSVDHPDDSIVKISQNTEWSPGDFRGLAGAQIQMKDHQLMLVWKVLILLLLLLLLIIIITIIIILY